MNWSARIELLVVLPLVAIMTLIFTEVAFAADAIPLSASEPYTIYYTTSGAEPAAPTGGTSTPTTYTNYYVAEGTKITPPTVVPASETISLVPDAGKGRLYVKPQTLKIHESKKEFEKHVKEKHGKQFKIEDFDVRQTEDGIEGHIYIVENKNSEILQLSNNCTEDERAHRIAVAKDFILKNPELAGITENEEVRERGVDRQHCGAIYFDRYINGYQFVGSVFRFSFVPQWNFGFSVHLTPITPEMYAAAQADALPPEEIAKIVYRDLNIPLDGIKPPQLEMRKYLRNKAPYVYWKIAYENVYEIDAITGEITYKQLNIRR